MIRFYEKQMILNNDMNVIIASEFILAGESVWNDAKKYFKQYAFDDVADVWLLPVNAQLFKLKEFDYFVLELIKNNDADNKEQFRRFYFGEQKDWYFSFCKVCRG